MIYIVDDFVQKNLFEIANKHLDSNEFKKMKAANENFYIQQSNKEFDKYITQKISIIEGKEIKNILSFFRIATDKLDVSWRIHSCLLYTSPSPRD